MRQFILDFPNQFKKGIEAAKNAKLKCEENYENLIVCGMGGSALPAEILKTAPCFTAPLFIHRSYGLPKEASKKSLVFISSYSGNTEEAISAFNAAAEKNLKIIGFGRGGKLEELCSKNNIFFVKYPFEAENFQPRFALGMAFSAMLYAAHIFSFMPREPLEKLEEIKNILKEKSGAREEEGKMLAEKISGKIVLIYAPYNFKALSYIWKINFNETTKILAFANCYPELNHNEIAGFSGAEKTANCKIMVLNLLESGGDEKLLKRAEITAEVLKSKGFETIPIAVSDENYLEKYFSSIILSMWTSYYLALARAADPTTEETIEDFKTKLR